MGARLRARIAQLVHDGHKAIVLVEWGCGGVGLG
jgi:hypothetical protein